ncbi:MAG: hypothetical protein ACI9JK_001747 [Phycisphaerales bacterium]
MSLGSELDEVVNWSGSVKQRVREFAARILATKTKRVCSNPYPRMSLANQRALGFFSTVRNPLPVATYRDPL